MKQLYLLEEYVFFVGRQAAIHVQLHPWLSVWGNSEPYQSVGSLISRCIRKMQWHPSISLVCKHICTHIKLVIFEEIVNNYCHLQKASFYDVVLSFSSVGICCTEANRPSCRIQVVCHTCIMWLCPFKAMQTTLVAAGRKGGGGRGEREKDLIVHALFSRLCGRLVPTLLYIVQVPQVHPCM